MNIFKYQLDLYELQFYLFLYAHLFDIISLQSRLAFRPVHCVLCPGSCNLATQSIYLLMIILYYCLSLFSEAMVTLVL